MPVGDQVADDVSAGAPAPTDYHDLHEARSSKSRTEASCSLKRAMASQYRRTPQLTRATPSSASSASDGACGSRTTFHGPRTSEAKRRSASASHSTIG